MYVLIDYVLVVLLKVEQNPSNIDFEVQWPRADDMKCSASLIEHKRDHEHLLTDIFAVMDGAQMPRATYSDADLQNVYYEGYTQSKELKTS